MASLSVVIAAKNCRDRIEGTIVPWKKIAQEVIVVDQLSTDGTAELAGQLGSKVIVNEPAGGNFDLNRKVGMLQAKSDWILYIDTDERPTPELLDEIAAFLKSADATNGTVEGVRIPNLFYFLGKPLKHGIYNPNSAEIRMVRSGRWDYPCEKGFHHGVSVGGKVIRLKHAYKHFNVNSLSEWFIKTNQYTEHDAKKNYKKGSRKYWAYFDAFRFFVRHYFFRLGFLDGFHGLVSVFYFMLYHLTLQVKFWEYEYKEGLVKNEDYLDPIEGSKR